MKLCDSPPCRILADFVECYWYVDAGADETQPRPDAILPNGTSNLIFNLSGFEHREYSDADYSTTKSLKTRWFSGIREAAIVVGPTVCTRVVGVRFKPAGLLPFLKVPTKEVSGFTIDADELWGQECELLHEQLYELHSIRGQFSLLENWLLKRFAPQPAQLGLIRCVDSLQQAGGSVSIEALAASASLSIRQFRRRFEQAVGMPPKRLARILRFEKLIQRLGVAHDSRTDFAGLAFGCGYYDQSHLIADFRDFAGVTPTEYLRRKPIVPGFLPVDAPVSLFSNTAPRPLP